MPGGLLNIIAITSETYYLIGNPSTTFFYTTYNHFCNFGKQKFRVDYFGNNNLQQTTSTDITFQIPRYGDLLTDTYLVVTLPHIFSPIYTLTDGSSNVTYDFKWIKDIGCNMIEKVTIRADGTQLQTYSGQYLRNIVERDYDNTKKDLFNKMTGNVKELYAPYTNTEYSLYPTYSGINNNPSINMRKLYIPINSWFSSSSYQALPLVAMQYNNLYIDFTLRPLQDLYVTRDLANYQPTPIISTINADYFSPATAASLGSNKNLGAADYTFTVFTESYDISYIDASIIRENQRIIPNFDIHIICTQVFLSEEERTYLSQNNLQYIVKEIRELRIQDIVGSTKFAIDSHGLIIDWMWFLQRSDIGDRNEWSNYTNRKYQKQNSVGRYYYNNLVLDPSLNVLGVPQSITTPYILGESEVEIMQSMAIICDGAYRENTLYAGVYNYVEKYNSTPGDGKDGLYCYNFTLNTDRNSIQPYGVFNTNFFKTTEFELTVLTPYIDTSGTGISITCNDAGEILSISKSNKQLYEYTYTFTLQEERYNFIEFKNGMVGLKYAK